MFVYEWSALEFKALKVWTTHIVFLSNGIFHSSSQSKERLVAIRTKTGA